MNEEIKKLIEEEASNRYLEYLHGTSNGKEFLSMTDLMPLHDAIKSCEITVNFILSKWQEAERWRKVGEELPPLGEEVLFFHEDWIDEDFNPKGVRIGFRLDDDYVTAHYWSHQDCYMTISHSECDNNAAFSDKTKKSIEPHKWKPIS